ncbi:MAG: ATP synthase F1 subunit epsilon [Pseudomonadota bacterium]|nr:ATP synthase F1 subunit epsilon [Pseudomonadota bacterium]
MSSKINFEFVSPESSLFSGEVVSVLLPAKEGDAEILPLHAPFMTALRVGIVEIKVSESENMKFLIDGGFADVANDNVTLLAEKSFNLLESNKEDFLIELDKVNKSLEETEDLIERESLLAKKLILESNN